MYLYLAIVFQMKKYNHIINNKVSIRRYYFKKYYRYGVFTGSYTKSHPRIETMCIEIFRGYIY